MDKKSNTQSKKIVYLYNVATSLGTHVQSNVIQYNCSPIKSTSMMPITLVVVVVYWTALSASVSPNMVLKMKRPPPPLKE